MKSKLMRIVNLLGVAAYGILACLSLPGEGFSQELFYKGKTITMIQGREPGGTGDMRVRAMIPFLQKYIPGNPTIISEYMPGGGGRKATNYIFKGARPEGLTIGNVGSGLVANAVLGETGVQYDLDKLIYLGAANSANHYIFGTNAKLGLNNLTKLRAYSGVRIGAQTVNHDVYIWGRLFAWFLDLKNPKFVTGYSGPEINIALMNGEVDARAQLADVISMRNPEWVTDKLVDFHAIVEIPKGDKHPAFPKLPEMETFARSSREAKVIALQRAFRLAGSPSILPPGTPRERVTILREALTKTFQDPAFPKEFRKLAGEDPTPLIWDKLEKSIVGLPREKDTIALFRKLTGTEPFPPR